MAQVTFRAGTPEVIDYTPSGGNLAGGDVVLLGNTTGLTCGVAPANGLLNNVKGSLEVGGGTYDCVNLNNAANYTTVYWDNAVDKVTTVSTNNAKFGYIVDMGAGGANTTCRVLHHPKV